MLPIAMFFIILTLTGCPLVSGHMGIEPPTAPAGDWVIVSLRIGHDCGDDTVGTTNFTVVLPKYLDSVTIEQLPDWRVFIRKVNGTQMDKDKYYEHLLGHHGSNESTPEPSAVEDIYYTPSPEDLEPIEYIDAISYLGFLPDDFYRLFNVRISVPDLPGAKLWFKGYQDCHNQGISIAWDMIPTEENPDPAYPAGLVDIVASEEDKDMPGMPGM